MRIVTPDEMRALEARYMADSGITSARLMGRAADGLLKAAIALMGRDEWPPREMNIPSETARLIGLTAIVCCGPGANGGDGWALAWRLCDMHCAVAVLTVGEPQPGSAAHDNYLKCLKAGRAIRIIDLKQVGLDGCEDGGQILAQMKAMLGDNIARAQLCVDAMFGTGFARAMSGAYLGMARLMLMLRAGGARVLAVDVPSGLSGLTGEDMGACPADATVTFQFLKRGQLLKAGQDLCGRLICHDIGIPERYAPEDAPTYVQADDVSLPRRRHDSHKGTYGHLLMIAGSADYAGAALMAVSAALRAGAGLVSTACVRDIRQLMQLRAPEAMAMKATDADVLDEAAVERIAAALPGKTALAVGPGLTRRAAPEVVALALCSGLPAVVDADALNIISEHPELRGKLNKNHVLTPHPGEMARLLGRACGDPVEDARMLAKGCGCVVLLKGCATCISDGERAYMMNPGAPGMACGGSGDVLTGVIGALLAQGMEPVKAAVYGAMLHGRAGVLAQEKLGEYSMNAGDIIDGLPGAFMEADGAICARADC